MAAEKVANTYAFVHEELYFPSTWKISSRIKFACVAAVSVEDQLYIAFGTNNGSVYLFQRIGTELHHMTTLKKEEEPVTNLLFSASGSHIACALRDGLVVIFSLNFRKHLFECVRVSQLHKESSITGMAWSEDAMLYSGDNKGFMSVTFVPASKSKDLISIPSAPVQNLSSPIVQIDCYDNLICVSTEKSVFLFDREAKTFRTVGSKPRQGKFGACITPEPDGGVKMFCARPGYRIWQTEGDNVVSVTHQYKDFAKLPTPRPWGQPMLLKQNSPMSGVFAYLCSITPSIVLCVDINSNFCFFDRVARSAMACLPCAAGLVSYSAGLGADIHLLLEGNRICSLRYLPFATAANALIASPWISDAVEFLVSAPDPDLVTHNITEIALTTLIDSAGEFDANFERLLGLREAIREWAAAEAARVEGALTSSDTTDPGLGNGLLQELDLNDGFSETSEPSICSSLDSQELESRGAAKGRRNSDLLHKMRTRLKATSDRVRHELSSSERAQSLVRMVKDKTTKIRTDAEQFIVERVNLMPPGVPTELDASQDLLDPPSPRSPRAESAQRSPTSRPTVLNFVELEAVASISWQRWSSRGGRLSNADAEPALIRRSLAEFIAVMNRLIFEFLDLTAASANGQEEPPDGDVEPATARSVGTMTMGEDLRRSFPMPAKLLDLCGRLAVLAAFIRLAPEREPSAAPDSPGDLGERCQASQFPERAEGDVTAEDEVDANALATVEALLDGLDIYADFGFEDAVFRDLSGVVHADIGFWRSCLQVFPVSRRSFRQHVAVIGDLLKERRVRFDQINWASVEVLHGLETSMVTEPMIAYYMLLRLLEERPQQGLRFCVKNATHVSLRDVFNLLLHHRRPRLLLDYVRAMMEEERNLAEGCQFVERLQQNDDIFVTIVALCALYDNEGVSERWCDSCQAKTFLNLEPGPSGSTVSFLFKSCGSARAMEVAEKWLLDNGHVRHYAQALVSRGRCAALIHLAFNLDRSDLVLMLDRLTATDIKQIADLMTRASPSCYHCGAATADRFASWDWPLFGHLVAQSLSTPLAVQLLAEVDLPATADLGALFQTFAVTSLNAARPPPGRKPSADSRSSHHAAVFAACSQSWGAMVSELTECYVCGLRLLGDGPDRELRISPCCRRPSHSDCLPVHSFCVVCLK